MKLQKYLTDRGIASRRGSAKIIEAGRVTVNGTVVLAPFSPIEPGRDKVLLDGAPLPAATERKRTIIMNKPRGYICSTSSRDGKTVYELLGDIEERLVPVGRLDKDSEGLLLMSNDGELIQRLTHPRYEHPKAYEVTVSGNITNTTLKTLNSPMMIEGYRISPARVRILHPGRQSGRTVLEFVLKEGRKRQIRHMCENAGIKVHRLIRTRIGSLTLSGLKPGRWREMKKEDLVQLNRPLSKNEQLAWTS